uniref:glutamine--fructose-6-phosphate transaminase (isomerizing) n=1 Tax=Globodera rostochiensis TaxID=31243 RepID=A0A914GVT1_GLORO
MCGIFAYLHFSSPKTRSEIIDTLLLGLRKTKCSGCDSFEIAIDSFMNQPNAGAVYSGRAELFFQSQEAGASAYILNNHCAIGNTFSEKNEHPQYSTTCPDFVVFHNGTITNCAEIKSKWGQVDDTDLLSQLAQGIYKWHHHFLYEIVINVVKHLKGSFALMIKNHRFPGKFAATRRGMVPLFVGIKTKCVPSNVPVFYHGEAIYKPHLVGMSTVPSSSQPTSIADPVEYFVASELSAVLEQTQWVVVLKDDDVVSVEDGVLSIYRIKPSEGSSTAHMEQTRPVHDLSVVEMRRFSALYLGSTELSNAEGTEDCRRAMQSAKLRVEHVDLTRIVLEVSLSGLNIRDLNETVLHCHPIGNIQAVCQDDVDKNWFAFILKEGGRRFCRVFCVLTAANEIKERLENATNFTYNMTPKLYPIVRTLFLSARGPQQQQQHQQKMFDGVQTTAAAAAVAGTPTATTTTDPQDSFITTLCSCTHHQQQQHRQQQIRPSRKEEAKSDRTRRIRVSTSLPNCALSREPKAEAEQHQNDVTAPEPVSLASVLNCSHKQQQQQQKGRGGRGCGVVGAVEKAKSRGPPEQRQQHNHHTPQHMAFLGTVRETVEFLRGTIGWGGAFRF